MTLRIWGGHLLHVNEQFPIPISVNADPRTNRASWVKAPYATNLGGASYSLFFPLLRRE
jgi:hypothetical protein